MRVIINILDSFFRRLWLTWRFIVALGYSPRVSWSNSRRMP
ncbi:hypothetical protein [Propionivibrio dicarboxylicus]|uniref:Uncharacterized protein n=1 Tax=Propionivibrio dicarboxylicus TaxID=83767 RepID=A0A1G8LA48_9RHOO|nr:hypothetical protein [Propionivibrio dicarboxylicus]SDI52367.1 hypothetical protein SAMN05660652_03580 [Propionivibrio dicarboxylicus]